VQEQRQLQLHSQVELRLKVAQLLVLGRQEEAVVVETNLTESDSMAVAGSGAGKVLQSLEESCGTTLKGVELLS
jgi:hypothetical protein